MIKNPEYVAATIAICMAATAIAAVYLGRVNARLARLTANLSVPSVSSASEAMQDISTALRQAQAAEFTANDFNQTASDFAFNGYTLSDPLGVHHRSIGD